MVKTAGCGLSRHMQKRTLYSNPLLLLTLSIIKENARVKNLLYSKWYYYLNCPENELKCIFVNHSRYFSVLAKCVRSKWTAEIWLTCSMCCPYACLSKSIVCMESSDTYLNMQIFFVWIKKSKRTNVLQNKWETHHYFSVLCPLGLVTFLSIKSVI